MITILYGSDTYRSRRRAREITDALVSKYPNEAIKVEEYDIEDENLGTLKDRLSGVSLFSVSRVVRINSAFSDVEHADLLVDLVEKIAEIQNYSLILWEGELTAEKKEIFTRVKKLADSVEEFKKLTEKEMRSWIQNEMKRLGISSPELLDRLLSYDGDLWRIGNELEKASLLSEKGTKEVTHPEPTIFQLGDTFFSCPSEALYTLHCILSSGKEISGVFYYLLNQTRTLTVIQSSLTEKISFEGSGIHPFVIQKGKTLARSVAPGYFSTYLQQFLEEDFRIKIGLSTYYDSLIKILFLSKRHPVANGM